MPTFCRHNRFEANCPICKREKAEAAGPRRPGVRSSGGPATRTRAARGGRRTGELRVRRVAREHDDGFRSRLVAGLKASGDAERLAQELAFAHARLTLLADDPPGLYAEVAAAADREEAHWLAFLIAYLSPLDADDPFAGVRAARTSWASGEPPRLHDVPLGPRTAHDPARGAETIAAYRAWAGRAGSQDAAVAGEPAWTPERRFGRAFERLALPGLHRDARFELLMALGTLGLHELRPGALALGGTDETTLAAKRIFGIGDTLLLERRAADLATACDVPLATLDVALWNWSHTGPRAALGCLAAEPDPDVAARVGVALGL